MSKCTIAPDQTSVDWMDPHLAHLTPASPPLLSSPPFPGGSETNSAPGLILLSSQGFSVEGWAAWEEVSTLLTMVTISHRDAFLGARPPHPLLTAATPDLPVTPSPPWRTLTLAQGLPLCSASANADLTVHVGSTIPMPLQQVDNLKPSEGLHPTQYISTNGTHIHSNTQTHIHSHT